VSLEDTCLIGIPRGMSFEDAAALPTAALSAWNALMGERWIQRGDVVLAQGTGGVSTFALEFAHAARATAIVTSSSDEKLECARTLDANETINYKTTPEWGGKVLELTKGHGADLIVEVGGRGTIEQSVKCLARFGTISIIGGLSGYGGNVPAEALLQKTARAVGIFVGSRADFSAMLTFITQQQIHPVIDHMYAVGEIDQARKQLEGNQVVGKLIVRM
jgi:NADPH:quinone reductase-like Zn-dependent oxidoreductase